MSNEKDWSIPDAGGIIDVPDRLQSLFNNIGMQIKLHTVSDKNEVITVAHITQHADSFARSQAIGFEEWYWSEYCPYYWMGGTYSHGETNEVVSTSELYELFLLWQKQQEGK